MKRQQETSYYNLLLNEETGRYVYRILALKQIIEYPREYDFFIEHYNLHEAYKYVEVKKTIKDLAQFAHEQGITYKTLKRFNPWLRNNSLKVHRNETYHVAIPIHKAHYQ